MEQELKSRVFELSPSNTRLVQMYMSKQMPARLYLSEAQHATARSLYLTMLRNAVAIARLPTRSSPPRAAKKARLTPSGGQLFRGLDSPSDDVQSPTTEPETTDPVVDEMHRWQRLDIAAHKDCISGTGLLNEFKLLWKVRKEFPLHFIVFKQTASHLPHEGNVEQIFSAAGGLSDPNMDPSFLAILTSVGRNKKASRPTTKSITEKYHELFGKQCDE